MTKCCKCEAHLDHDLTGEHPTSSGLMCDGCYYGELGDLVEQHPIVMSDRDRDGFIKALDDAEPNESLKEAFRNTPR